MMSRDQGSPERQYVRVSKSLNERESWYIEERKVKVKKCLWNNGIQFEGDHAPRIAVLGSGGGERAMVGMLGCLDQMRQENLLDSALYLCGVSGSTWCMSFLYEYPFWSTDVPNLKDKLMKRLTQAIDFQNIIEWLTKAIKYENYSLTDFWAATIVYNYIKEIDQSRLSDQERRDATNPYPIYTVTAVTDKGLKQQGHRAAWWFEVTPHEAGYSHVGAFVDTSVLGSHFEKGWLKRKTQERDMLYLQGLCGSALADKDEIIKWIKSVFGNTEDDEMFSHKRVPCDCQACKIINILLQLHDNREDASQLEKLCQLQSEISGSKVYPGVSIPEHKNWHKINSEERNRQIADLTVAICKCLGSWFGNICDAAKIVMKTLPVVYSWTWGTHSNFLFKYPAGEGKVPDMLLSAEHIYLEDAGFVINAPYVAALRAERKVDLILSFDFSAGDPFLTVNLAAEYCKESGIPFPPVDVPEEEKENPKDFYVFKGEQGPTVIHMPLFNIVNCGGDVKKWTDTYATFQRPYVREKIHDLLRVSSLNVANNKKRILEEIQAVCQRK